MESKHTPGPWHVGGDGTIIYSQDNFAVANATVFHGRHEGQSEANARLIAAAPELLKVLESMNHMGGDERGGYCICPLNDGSARDEKHASICADARAAIAKATGSQIAKC